MRPPQTAAPPAERAAERRGAAFSWLVAILLPIFLVYPALTYPIEERTVDAAAFHIYRGIVFSAARADGWLYPRWVQTINGGLGGPLFSFYSPLVYGLMDALHALGLAHALGWRVLVAAALVAVAAGTYQLALALFKRSDVALLAAVSGSYTPYLVQEFFRRGSPQGLAIALYPWVLWLLLRLAERPSGGRLAAVGLLWAALILLHNVAALIFLPFLGLFLIYLAWRAGRQALGLGLLAITAGSLVAAFYVLPFLAERQYIRLDNASQAAYTRPADNPLALSELLSAPPLLDTGLGNNTLEKQSIGLPLTALLVAGPLVGLALWRKGQRAEAVLAGGLALMGLTTVGLQTQWGTPLWAAWPALNLLQFRWRLLGNLGLAGALILGYGVGLAGSARWRAGLVVGLAALTIALQLPYLYPDLLPRLASFPALLTAADVQALALQEQHPGLTTFNELLPRWRTAAFSREEMQRAAASPIANLPAGGHILAADRHTTLWRVQLDSPSPFTAAFYLLYFPGWHAYVDDLPQTPQPQPDSGYLLVDLPAGQHTVTLRYEGTTPQHVGELTTALTLLALLSLTLLWPANKPSLPAPTPAYLTPHLWLPATLLLLATLKAAWLDPHTTWLRQTSTCTTIAGATAQTNVLFAEHIHLCGYTLAHTTYHPGDTLQLTLYWQPTAPLQNGPQTFVHLLGTTVNPETGNPLWGQQDKWLPGERLLSQWEPGKLYRDAYEFRIPPLTPPGTYQLEIGWWEPANGTRLKPCLENPTPNLTLSNLDALLISNITVR